MKNLIEFEDTMLDTFEVAKKIATNIQHGKNKIIVTAPPKCGKRIIEEIVSLYLNSNAKRD